MGKHTLTATPYQYRNGTGLKGKAHKVTFTVGDPTATYRIAAANKASGVADEESTPGASLGALPNPFSGTTTISFSVPQTSYTSVQLYNSSGALMENVYGAVAEKGIVYRIPLQSMALQSGVYVLKLTSGVHLKSYKLVLVR